MSLYAHMYAHLLYKLWLTMETCKPLCDQGDYKCFGVTLYISFRLISCSAYKQPLETQLENTRFP